MSLGLQTLLPDQVQDMSTANTLEGGIKKRGSLLVELIAPVWLKESQLHIYPDNISIYLFTGYAYMFGITNTHTR